jgi:Domain of unknown function (DUF1818)
MGKVLKSGPGWRVGWNPEATLYTGLIGNDDWAIELTTAELDDFCRLALQLATAMVAMATELMDEESISLEAESDRVWIEIVGFPQGYDLRFILSGDRQVEGYWEAAIVPALLQALPTLKVW